MSETTPDSPEFLDAPDEPEVTADTRRRLVVRLVGGEELELGGFDDRDGAVQAAQDLVTRFNSAETSGEWPQVEGRFLRPAAIVSVDVLARD